jgi:hypothetical protein
MLIEKEKEFDVVDCCITCQWVCVCVCVCVCVYVCDLNGMHS